MPAAKVRADGLRRGALHQHIDEAAVRPLKSVHRSGRWSDGVVLVELGTIAVHARHGALRDVVDNVHDLALLKVMASQRLRHGQVDLLQFGQQLVKRAFAQLRHVARH